MDFEGSESKQIGSPVALSATTNHHRPLSATNHRRVEARCERIMNEQRARNWELNSPRQTRKRPARSCEIQTTSLVMIIENVDQDDDIHYKTRHHWDAKQHRHLHTCPKISLFVHNNERRLSVQNYSKVGQAIQQMTWSTWKCEFQKRGGGPSSKRDKTHATWAPSGREPWMAPGEATQTV